MPGETPFLVAHTTLPDENSARKMLRDILQARLAACGHAHKILSAYWWEGRLRDEEEWLVSFKTVESRWHALEKAIKDAHPYEVPMILALPVEALHAPYGDFLQKETS